MRAYWSTTRGAFPEVSLARGYSQALGRPWPLFFKGAHTKLKGKSLKWSRRGASIVLRVGVSHLVSKSMPWDLSLRRSGKIKLVLWGTVIPRTRRWSMSLRALKYPNLYHGRGVRVSKTLLYRKDGKVSAYR